MRNHVSSIFAFELYACIVWTFLKSLKCSSSSYKCWIALFWDFIFVRLSFAGMKLRIDYIIRCLRLRYRVTMPFAINFAFASFYDNHAYSLSISFSSAVWIFRAQKIRRHFKNRVIDRNENGITPNVGHTFVLSIKFMTLHECTEISNCCSKWSYFLFNHRTICLRFAFYQNLQYSVLLKFFAFKMTEWIFERHLIQKKLLQVDLEERI